MKETTKLYLIIIGMLVFLTTFPCPLEKDFYEFHIYECEEAHKINMTFAVCSGFVYPPEASDLKNPCLIHPSEPCKDNVAHGSNTGQKELRPLLNIFNIHY